MKPRASLADPRPTAVYRLWDAEGSLLYVGMTINVERRVAAHRSGKPWGKQIARTTHQVCEDRWAAARAEAEAIQNEGPRFNRYPLMPRRDKGQSPRRKANPLPVEARRREMGFTQAELAKAAGTSQVAISYLEAGRLPGLAIAYAVAAALDSTVQELFPMATAVAS